jgi:hypothetical protein
MGEGRMRVNWTGQHAKDDLKTISEGELKRGYMAVIRNNVTQLHWGTDEGRCRFFEFYICYCKKRREQKGFVAKTLASAALDSITGVLAPATGIFELADFMHPSHREDMSSGYQKGLAHAVHKDESDWARVMLDTGQVVGFVVIAYEELLHPECVKVYLRRYDLGSKLYFLGLMDQPDPTRLEAIRNGTQYTKFLRRGNLVRVRG